MNLGVQPCFKNTIKVGAVGCSDEELLTIADMESLSATIDGNIEEWKTLENEGKPSRLKTGISLTLSLSGKRNKGDAGNDFLAGKAFAVGHDAEARVVWTLPDDTKVEMAKALIDVKELAGGNTTDVAPLSVDILSNGNFTVV